MLSLFKKIVTKLALACALLVIPAAAQTFVQVNTNETVTPTTTLTIPYTSSQTAGNLNIVAIGWNNSTNDVTTVTDTKGNTYTRAIAKASSSTISQTIFYAKNIVAGNNTITVTWNTNASSPDVRVLEYSGLDKVNPVDVTAVGTGNSASGATNSVTTNFPNELIFGTGTTATHFNGPGTGFTSRVIDGFGSIAEDRSVTSTGSYSASGPINGTALWVMQMVGFHVALAAPTVAAIAPISGPIAGGTAVTVTGTGFLSGATLFIGGVQATGLVVVNSTTITATTAANSAGADNVVVTNIDSQAGTLASGFTYIVPGGINFVQLNYGDPTSASSVSVPYLQTQTVGNLNIVVVSWNDQTSSVTSVIDTRGNTYLLAVGPTTNTAQFLPNTLGLRESIYYAKNIAGLSSNTVTVTFNATAQFPDVTILEYSGLDKTSPLDATAASATAVALANSGSATTTSANELILGAGATAGAFTTPGVGFTTRVITQPDFDITEEKIVSSIGTYNATATQSGSPINVMQMATFRGAGQLFPAPTITSISPVSGTAAGGTAVTVTGTGFLAGASLTIGGAPAASVSVVNSTTITAGTPSHATGAVNVVVTNTDTQVGTLVNGFTYTGIANPAPTVVSMTPTSGPVSGGTLVTITGTGFLNGATATFGGTIGTNVNVVSPTTITANVPAHAVGAVNVVVTNTDTLNGTLSSGYTYVAAPTVSSITPNSGGVAGGTSVTIAGTGFLTGVTVTIGGVTATNIVRVSGISITAKTPASSAGTVGVVVTNTDGQSGTLGSSYTYVNPAPTVVSISPTSGTTVGGTTVVITGTNFLNGATVTVGGSAATASVLSSTQISIVTPAHAAATVSTVVTNPDSQTATGTNDYTYVLIALAPTATAINPSTGSINGGDNVTITGTHFLSGITVTVGGVSLTGVVVVNTTTVTGVTGPHAAGIVDVVVTNTDAQTGTLSNGYTYQDFGVGTATATGSTGSITILGAEQTQNKQATYGTGQISFSGTCTVSCGPFSVTVNGHTDSTSYVQGSNAGIGFVQASSTQRASQTSVSVLFTKAQVAGDLNIVVVKWNGTPTVIKSVTDTSGNAYGLAVGPTQGFGIAESIYYSSNVLGAGARDNTVVVTFDTPATFPDVHVYEYAGLGSLDVTSAATGTTNPTNSGPATTTLDKELIFGTGAGCGQGFIPSSSPVGLGFVRPGSGFIQRQITPYGNLGEDKTVFSIGSYTTSGFVNCSGWVMQLASFWAGVTPNIIATQLATKINADRLASVRATASGTTLYLTSKTSGTRVNYPMSVSTCCNVSMTSSGSTLTGGAASNILYDAGTVTAVINGKSYVYSYGQGDDTNSVASGLAAIINADISGLVVATTAGKTINLTSKAVGAVNYTISASSVTTSATFLQSSFTTIPSGSTMTGGGIQHVVHLVWPASVSVGVVGYNIYRGTFSGGPYVLIAPIVPGLSYNDTTVISGATYYYVITSVDNIGREGVYSVQGIAVVPSP